MKRRTVVAKQNMEKLRVFLSTESFADYMEHFEFFHGLVMGKDTFAHEMKLMEADGTYTHREKEKLVQKKKREIVKVVRGEIDVLRDEILTQGVWRATPEEIPETVMIRVPAATGKAADVDRSLLRAIALELDEDDGGITGEVLTDYRSEIEAMIAPRISLFRGTSFDEMMRTPSAVFLMRTNRIFEVQAKMAYLNYYTEEYSNMKSVKDPVLRGMLGDHQKRINDFRNMVYEDLLAAGSVRGKWISEQTAFRIIRKHFPDARYQYQPDWLGYQSLDIYIPSLRAAVEYQGKQHSEAVEFFGGEAGLLDNQMRDERKRRACEKNSVKLATWNYDEPLTEEYFTSEILPKLCQGV